MRLFLDRYYSTETIADLLKNDTFLIKKSNKVVKIVKANLLYASYPCVTFTKGYDLLEYFKTNYFIVDEICLSYESAFSDKEIPKTSVQSQKLKAKVSLLNGPKIIDIISKFCDEHSIITPTFYIHETDLLKLNLFNKGICKEKK
mgnify:CR=1 FL=1